MSKKRAFLGLILGFLTVVLISVAIPFLYMKIAESRRKMKTLYRLFVHIFKDMTRRVLGILSEDRREILLKKLYTR